MKKFNAYALWIALVAAVLLLGSCDSKEHFKDLRDYMSRLKAATFHRQKKPEPSMKLPAPVTYQAGSLRAPFETRETVQTAGKVTVPKHPLQAYPLNMLRFVGTVSKRETTNAYILTPDNIVHEVKPGDLIGDHGGKVTSIYPDRVNVSEEESGPGKASVQRITTMQLKEER